MELKEKKIVTQEKDVTIGYKCDACGKIHHGNFPNEWHFFSIEHREWGNDSIDSYESFEVCSPQCYINKISDIINGEYSDKFDAKIDSMEIQFARNFIELYPTEKLTTN